MRINFTIPVRARKDRPPAGMEGGVWTPWQRLSSSNIEAVRYREADLTLEVMFRSGAVYRYDHVPARTVAALLTASSPGKFLNDAVKPLYKARKVS